MALSHQRRNSSSLNRSLRLTLTGPSGLTGLCKHKQWTCTQPACLPDSAPSVLAGADFLPLSQQGEQTRETATESHIMSQRHK